MSSDEKNTIPSTLLDLAERTDITKVAKCVETRNLSQ